MSVPEIDQQRWEEVSAADLDVLRRLAEQGDKPEVARLVDVSFRGSEQALDRLQAAASDFGFDGQSRDNDGSEEPLFLKRVQTTDLDAMRELTMTYLQIEDAFGVGCDGWGSVAQTGGIN